MNKTMKKLGLLIVAAVAMAIGVNGASALKIGTSTNHDAVNPLVSGKVYGGVKYIDNGNGTYNLIATGNINDESLVIEVEATDIAFVNFGSYTYRGTLTVNGYAQITAGYFANASDVDGTGILDIVGGYYDSTSVTTTTTVIGGGYFTDNTTLDNFAVGYRYDDYQISGFYAVIQMNADDTNLQNQLNKYATYYADQVANTTYTKAAWNQYQTAYNAALNVKHAHEVSPYKASQQYVLENAAAKLEAAEAVLLQNVRADYSVFQPVYNTLYTQVSNPRQLGAMFGWTNASLTGARDVLARAQANSDLNEHQQYVVDALTAEMADWVNGTNGRGLVAKADYSRVNTALEIINSLNAENFTAESWTELMNAKNSTNMDLPAYKQLEVEKQYNILMFAVKHLTKASTSAASTTGAAKTVGGASATRPVAATSTTTYAGTVAVNPNTAATGTASVVDTGDNVATYAIMNIVSLIALAGCGLVLRKQN